MKNAIRLSFLSMLAACIQMGGRIGLGLFIPMMMGPRDYGQFTYLMWISAFLIQIASGGLGHAAQRFIPQTGGKTRTAVARFVTQTSVGLAVVTYTALLAWHFLFPAAVPLEAPARLLIGMIVLLGTYTMVRASVLRGFLDFGAVTMSEAVGQFTRILGLVVLWFSGAKLGPWSILCVEAAGYGLQMLVLALRKPPDPEQTPDLSASAAFSGRAILRYSLGVWVISIIDLAIWQRLEVTFLQHYSTLESVGFFSLAAQVATGLTVLPSVAVTSLLPTWAGLEAQDQAKLKRVFQLASTGVWALSGFILLVGTAVGTFAIRTVYGTRYGAAGQVLVWLMLGRVFLLVASVGSTYIYSKGKQSQLLWLVAVGAALALIMDYVLIPRFGLLGAGISVAIVQPIAGIGTVVVAGRIVGSGWALRPATLGGLLVAYGGMLTALRMGVGGIGTVVATLLYTAALLMDKQFRAVLAEGREIAHKWIRHLMSNAGLSRAE